MSIVSQLDEKIDQLEAEVRRLKHYEAAYKEFHDKTEWVQKTTTTGEWGKHRADILRERIEKLEKEYADEAAEHRKTQVNRDTWRSNYHEAMRKLNGSDRR